MTMEDIKMEIKNDKNKNDQRMSLIKQISMSVLSSKGKDISEAKKLLEKYKAI